MGRAFNKEVKFKPIPTVELKERLDQQRNPQEVKHLTRILENRAADLKSAKKTGKKVKAEELGEE